MISRASIKWNAAYSFSGVAN